MARLALLHVQFILRLSRRPVIHGQRGAQDPAEPVAPGMYAAMNANGRLPTLREPSNFAN